MGQLGNRQKRSRMYASDSIPCRRQLASSDTKMVLTSAPCRRRCRRRASFGYRRPVGAIELAPVVMDGQVGILQDEQESASRWFSAYRIPSRMGDSSSTRSASPSHHVKKASATGFDFSIRACRFFLRGDPIRLRSIAKSCPLNRSLRHQRVRDRRATDLESGRGVRPSDRLPSAGRPSDA